jgi:DNA adenine methylase
MALDPIFRWAGSKRKLLATLLANVPDSYGTYVEPFAGSACLFFALEPPKAVLGDFNAHLIEAYRIIARQAIHVHGLTTEFPVTSEQYYNLRAIPVETLTAVQRAARFLYLNRYCFNGVYRTNKKGLFNVPRGRDTGVLPDVESIRQSAMVLRRARFVTGDFKKTLACVKSKDFVYIDPPYAKTDDRYSGEYGYGAFSSADFGRLRKELERIDRKGATFLLSYRYARDIQIELSPWYTTVVSVRRHVAGFSAHRRTVKELLVSNRPLKRAKGRRG